MNQKIKTRLIAFFAIGAILITMNACKKKEDAPSGPVITTNAITNITTKTATSGGNISDAGGKDIIGRGVCWGTSQNPTLAQSTFNGGGTGSFTSNITGLKANTTYYVRAYAATADEEFYGNQLSFKTPSTGPSSLSCLIDGTPYSAATINVVTSSGKVGISGMNGTKNVILWLPDPFTTGSHSLSTFGDYMGQYSPNTGNIFTSESGTINITEYVASSGKIKGTFKFVGNDNSSTKEITSGQFEVYK